MAASSGVPLGVVVSGVMVVVLVAVAGVCAFVASSESRVIQSEGFSGDGKAGKEKELIGGPSHA